MTNEEQGEEKKDPYRIPGYPRQVNLTCKKCGRRATAVVKYPIAAWMCGKCTGAIS